VCHKIIYAPFLKEKVLVGPTIGVFLIARLHIACVKKPNTQGGRPLRRYKRRWKVERTLAWLGNYGRLLVHWECHLVVYLGFFHLDCALIAPNKL
jgi:hypothetical protein